MLPFSNIVLEVGYLIFYSINVFSKISSVLPIENIEQCNVPLKPITTGNIRFYILVDSRLQQEGNIFFKYAYAFWI